MIKIDEAIIVEGKYDKIKLSSIVDAVIITTNGFGIFKDKEKLELIRYYAKKTGIVILTDSDSAGRRIRGYIKGAVGGGRIINVFIPDVFGKEKRKPSPSAEGILGVEGTDDEIILDALTRAGIIGEATAHKGREITKLDLFNLGLSGGENSAERRASLLRFLKLPENLPANSMLDVFNTLYGFEDFLNEVEKWSRE